MEAEEKAVDLFNKVLSKDMIKPGLSEEELNIKIHSLAYEMFGITQYWHKRIVRAGRNTIYPYRDNPKNLIIKDDDILFFDFGPGPPSLSKKDDKFIYISLPFQI